MTRAVYSGERDECKLIFRRASLTRQDYEQARSYPTHSEADSALLVPASPAAETTGSLQDFA
jgi:hypothetical protein